MGLPVGSGRKRTGKRVLMVGTDCAVGKKYSALAPTDALRSLGVTVNTSGLPRDEREAYLAGLADEVGVPCVDPVIDGCAPIARLLVD
jgi:uncharacterized NAD-dependent epimerase/dehydratase family protein